MARTENPVALFVDGREIQSWVSLTQTSNLEALVDTLEATLPAHRGAGIAGGEEVLLRYRGEPVFSGWLDAFAVKASSTEARMELRARAKTADVVDSSVDLEFAPSEIFNVDLEEVVRVYAFFALKIAFRNLAGALPTIPKVAAQVGESTFDVLERYARQSGVMLRTDPTGRLVMERVGTSPAPAPLVLGGNLLEFEASTDLSTRFHFNKVVGQSTVADDFSEDPSIAASGESVDQEMRPTRVLVTQSAGPAGAETCQAQAEWQAAIAAARSRQVTGRVNGWDAGAGRELWQPNRLVDFEADRFGLRATLLCRSVVRTAADDGLKTQLELVDRASYAPMPERQEETTGLAAKLKETGWGEA